MNLFLYLFEFFYNFLLTKRRKFQPNFFTLNFFIHSDSFSQSSGIFAPMSKITKADSIQRKTSSNSRPTSASRIAQAQVSQSSSRASSRSSSRANSRPSSRSNSPAPSSRVNGIDESLGFQVSFQEGRTGEFSWCAQYRGILVMCSF